MAVLTTITMIMTKILAEAHRGGVKFENIFGGHIFWLIFVNLTLAPQIPDPFFTHVCPTLCSLRYYAGTTKPNFLSFVHVMTVSLKIIFSI